MAPSSAVLITGCSTGIGRATAQRLLADGRPVWASARSLDAIADLADLGARTLALDVTEAASMQAAVAEVEAVHGAVGALVNNAGYGLHGPVEELDPAAVRRQFETNVFGLLRLSQLVLPGMRAQRSGRIVNVSSMGGRMTLPGGGAYHASKYAVEALSDALRFEVAGFGVRVSLVEPGPVLTEFVQTALDTNAAPDGGSGPYTEFRASLAASVAGAYQGRSRLLASSPERVARAIQHAVSATRPRSRYVVGPTARLLINARRVLPDVAWDALIARQYDRPNFNSSVRLA
jgi:NAD(P)-dependent dehydrogenase (short-subunit alcohol dehydrogenase family)